MRPLDRVGSIKLKLGAVIVAAVLVTVGVLELGRLAGWPALPVTVGAVVVALGMVQILAHGMTFPLRQMARAATQLAAGERHEPVTATSRDEVGELARAFNRMADEVAETDRFRRDLVANVSHELRTPIAALRAVLENIADGVEDADPATVERLVRQSERLQSLVEALLDLSRLEAGVTQLDVAEVGARELLDEAVELVGAPSDPPVRVRVDPPKLRVVGDERRLVQVLVNLLSNAHRHAPEGSEVELAAVGRAGEVELSVTDAGPGVAPEDAERIFERFHRSGEDGHAAARGEHGTAGSDHGTRRSEPGTSRTGTDAVGAADRPAGARGGAGLGLAISRWIVELHGGRIGVDTDHRTGCRMVVTLPHGQEDS